MLKRNAMAAPFEHAYTEHYKLKEAAAKYTSEEAPQGVQEGGEIMAIHYRDEEAIYVKASHDRVTVIFSTIFREETDRVFGKVFIQEFVDARRRAIQNAPQVLFRNDPPLELQNVPGVSTTTGGDVGYVTFGVFYPAVLTKSSANFDSLIPSTSDTPEDARCYLPYSDFQGLFPLPHQSIKGMGRIKHCSWYMHSDYEQAYIHSRMRRRTADFLQGKPIPAIKLRFVLIRHSPAPSPAGERRERKEDGKRKDIQSSGGCVKGALIDRCQYVMSVYQHMFTHRCSCSTRRI